jgi:hypothetical protein
VRIHPITLALRYLRGRRTFRGAPFYGRPVFPHQAAAIRVLKDFTGQDFGTNTRRWSLWLRKNGFAQYCR